ncbi:hypothetical protein ABN034_12045 [Actinopolymorpha sp. B11F2]|uniref:hypothetical protein n=1 Tax=Actinopolymorpha sp. B11F2 TaxID=3160862 RepID=UPI0032E39863
MPGTSFESHPASPHSTGQHSHPSLGRSPLTSRRSLLAGGGLLGVAAATGLGIPAPPARAAPASAYESAAAYDYTSRETFDTFDRIFHEGGVSGQPDEPNEAGGLAWGQSYVLLGFLRMYEAYRDTYYLDRLITNVDLMLDQRDSVRGATDYRGRSLPAWRATNPYTVGTVELTDSAGHPVLEVRSARAYADTTTGTVRAGSSADSFTLEVRNARYGYVDTFANLVMDPASPDYAVRRVYDAYPTLTMTTARDLRGAGDEGGLPAHGTFSFASQPVIFAVHTGMITYPVAAYVRTVYDDPKLRKDPHYKGKADEYLAAVTAAVTVHDDEWRESDGLGYLQWPKGMPVPYDGTEQPVNQSTALGQTYAELAAATGSARYRSRTRAMARMVATQLTVDSDQAYVWTYWPKFGVMYEGFAKTGSPDTDVSAYTPAYGSGGVGAQQIEDLSHGAISVEFAALAFREKLAFDGSDMARFARTYADNLATEADGVATTFVRVDGSGALATSGQYLQAPRWLPVVRWDDRIFPHCRAVYVDHDVQPGYGSGLAAIGYLNWAARGRT